ncbi:site-specific integrase [Parapedobacter indicus]|uniref:Phage integrase SAM-like domain-containing protein n=1 Tax=Parapedobacter indicus TaxID=1477437 RepID=A0A1I3DZF0_9SPHI|nr:site-specific integrase [Parapedobacter indicus]PPL04903.1 integrase-like protein [Parapedobacter indicus]SFH92033.1 Phage integrase SAM-like domain-containing protein [Parapedobacter indicus]
MATVNAVILNHHRKQDGTWNVKIRVTHKKSSVYIDTPHFVSKPKLNNKGQLKKTWIDAHLVDTLNQYRLKIGDLKERLDYMTASSIRDHLTTREDLPDFFGFADAYMKREAEKGRQVMTLGSAVLSLRDYWGEKPLPMDMFTARLLTSFEEFLRKERNVVRRKRNGGTYTSKVTALSHNSIVNRMSTLRAIFNAARFQYNDEDVGIIRIKNYPFNKYRMNVMKATKKRNLSVDQIISIRDTPDQNGYRTNLGRDLFMLSLYLCGMNAKDLYVYLTDTDQTRLDYNRSKTMKDRRDDAFISLLIPDEARPIIARYAGVIQTRYADNLILNSAIAEGMRNMRPIVGIPDLTFYHARHSFATLARNECGFSKDDVAVAMNHVDSSRRVTDIYLAPDWSIVDRVQAGVLELLKK